MKTRRLQIYDAEFDPDGDETDFGRNWGDAADGTPGYLHDDEDIIISSWEITADKEAVPTLIMSGQGKGISDDKKSTAIFLIGGTHGVKYQLTNEITTVDAGAANRTARKTGIIICKKN